jgi:hypothetical protein
MQNARPVSALALLLLTGSNMTAGSQPHLAPVSKSSLCVTEGTIEELSAHRLAVNVSKMRAYVNAYTEPEAQARFTYLGATPNEAPLASGEMRRNSASSYAPRMPATWSTPCGASSLKPKSSSQ